MTVPRLLVLGLAGCALLEGCGTSHSTRARGTPATAAVGGSAVISPRLVQEYMNYVLQFYSWADTSASVDGTSACPQRSKDPPCMTLRKQVVQRLLEEHVVADYAAQHRIRLTSSDTGRVKREMKRLQSSHSGTQRLFRAERVSPGVVRRVLQNQLLVRHVEASVVGTAALSGPSFRVRKYVFGRDPKSYKSALDLATVGIHDSGLRESALHWVAAFRLPTRVRSIAAVAANGDYLGPSLQGQSYVVYQFLGRSFRRYGRPARQEIELRRFRAWLNKRLESKQPECSRGGALVVPCTTLYH